MNIRRLRIGALVAMAMVPAAVPASAIALQPRAKTETVSFKLTSSSKSNAKAISGMVSGGLKGAFTGTISNGVTSYVLKVAGGRLDMQATFTYTGGSLKGKWHTTGGAGKFAHSHGSGTAHGTLGKTAVFFFTGSVTS